MKLTLYKKMMPKSYVIITVLCFFLTGCGLPYLLTDTELTAIAHMKRAAEQEAASDFQSAIETYADISETYPDTRYQKTAVLRKALLNLHPDNPEIDYSAAMTGLKRYLTLQLSAEENEAAQIYLSLLQKIVKNIHEKQKFLTTIKHLSKDKTALSKALKQSQAKAARTKRQLKKLSVYEAELSDLKNKLQKMKEIDVQMYKTRKDSTSKPLKSD